MQTGARGWPDPDVATACRHTEKKVASRPIQREWPGTRTAKRTRRHDDSAPLPSQTRYSGPTHPDWHTQHANQ